MWFKLDLESKPMAKDESLLSMKHPDPKAIPNPSVRRHVEAEKLTTAYLRLLVDHTNTMLRRTLTKTVVDTTPVRYTTTVPAMWSDIAKARTVKCASAAGMGDNVQVVSEPEAAVVYAIDDMKNNQDLQIGDSFILCDAGGGTVDLISKPILRCCHTLTY
jgi:molecular chaperone DnaK (HSP70)